MSIDYTKHEYIILKSTTLGYYPVIDEKTSSLYWIHIEESHPDKEMKRFHILTKILTNSRTNRSTISFLPIAWEDLARELYLSDSCKYPSRLRLLIRKTLTSDKLTKDEKKQ